MASAKDVERFAYCAHNWWLSRQGQDGHAASLGAARHRALGTKQERVEAEKREYRSAMAWSFRLLAVAASATFLIVELVYLTGSPQHLILLATALVMVSASAGLLVMALVAQEQYKRRQREAGLIPGRLVQSDLAGESPLLEDPAWGVSGRPDYLLQTKAGTVPVELKTGRTPEKPFESHVLQLACYLHLVQVKEGKRPAYGLLQYPDGVFRVDWTPRLEAQLQDVLARMKAAKAAGRADRDHAQPGRCRGCARRDVCGQKLV